MITHLASLIIYIVIIIAAADTGRLTNHIQHNELRRWSRAFCVAVIAMASAFSATQAAYALSGHTFNADDALDVMWLFFDWVNAIAYFSFIAALRVYVLTRDDNV